MSAMLLPGVENKIFKRFGVTIILFCMHVHTYIVLFELIPYMLDNDNIDMT